MSEYIEEYCHKFAREEGASISKKSSLSNNSVNSNLDIRERERERDQILSQQSQLLSEITQLESNPTKTLQQQADLTKNQEKLKDLQSKEKTLLKSLPLNTQITILEKEIKVLENKGNKTQTEQDILESKKKDLKELLKKQSNSNTTETKLGDRIGVYVVLGVIGLFTIFLIIVLARNHQRRKLKG